MPEYLGTVRDSSQQIAKIIVVAQNSKEAIFKLETLKYRVLFIEPRRNRFLDGLKNGRVEIGGPANNRDLACFSQNLSLMGLIREKLRST
jgi:type II secretory pathway component PulF